jgi:succinate dehydrogenase / fumarate reductase, membrane anchor subunit
VVTRRVVVGAHYGSGSWLAQRLTAVVMVAYTFALLAVLAFGPPVTYESWAALFARSSMRVATLLFVVSLAWHAWVGARDILMDYVKPDGLRLALEAATLLLLAVYLGWAVEILWR